MNGCSIIFPFQLDPNLDPNDYDLIVDLNPANFDVDGQNNCSTGNDRDYVQFFFVQNTGVVDNKQQICNDANGNPPFSTDLELVAKNKNTGKCIKLHWNVRNDGNTGAGFSFEFSSKFKFAKQIYLEK